MSALNRHIYTQFSTPQKKHGRFLLREMYTDFALAFSFFVCTVFLLHKHKTQHEIKMNPIYLHIPGLTLLDFLVQMFILSIFYQNVNNWQI